MRVLGPKRTLLRVRQNFRSGNNYTEAKLDELGPGTWSLWMNEIGPIRWLMQGTLHTALLRVGAREPRVDVTRFDDAGVTFAVTWRE